MQKINDSKWMKLALDLAEQGRFSTSPNPMVGACVIRNGVLVGKGYHQRYGMDHAEVNALKKAGAKTKGATLYVTLEPCSSWGKTPPCVAAIVQSGIQEVVIGSLDPNRKNHGRGVLALRSAGIQVRTGILSREVERQNEFFFKYITTQMPFVILKLAQSIDGKIATCEGKSRWISSGASRQFVHHLRAEQDAILIGRNTALLDDPLLSPRCRVRNGFPEKPWRIVLDPMLEVSTRARLFQGDQLTLLAVSKQQLMRYKKPKPHRILVPVSSRKDHLDLKELLKKLASLGVAKILVEGGGEVAWSLLEARLVDKAYWIIAPKILGGRAAKTSVEGEGIRNLAKAFQLRDTQVSKMGEDWLFEGRF